jgi:CBS domain-containing protein
MLATIRPLRELTAGDLMSRDVLQITETMPVREAARLLLLHQVSGAPVVEPGGTCVGVFSTTDILRWAHQPSDAAAAKGFQRKYRAPNGEVRAQCMLPADVCPLQRSEVGADGKERIFCTQPHSVPTDWQMVQVEEVEGLPAENVGQFMTPDPVLVAADTPVAELARQMVDAHIHRIVVVDQQRRPIGVVSTTDILARVAQVGRDASIEPEGAL